MTGIMTRIRSAFFSKYFSARTVKLGMVALGLLLASFAVSPAQAHAPRHITTVPCGPSYVALVYYHGSYYHRDAWVEWAHYTHLDFSQASVHLFPARHFRHGHYIGPGAYPFSKEYYHYSYQHSMGRLRNGHNRHHWN